MTQPITSLGLAFATGLSVAGSYVAILRLRRDTPNDKPSRSLGFMIGGCLLICLLLILQRWGGGDEGWHPISAHVDGLLLIGLLLAATVLYFLTRSDLRGMSAFITPVLSLILAWGVCAATWTYRPFESFDAVWRALHLVSVFAGTALAAIAAAAGGMYLFTQRRLKTQAVSDDGPLASLESVERVIVRASGLGFVLLSAALVTGGVILAGEPDSLGGAWYTSPKVWLAVMAWGGYALLMNVRRTTLFRGAYAAWTALGGFVLLVVIYGIVTSIPSNGGGA